MQWISSVSWQLNINKWEVKTRIPTSLSVWELKTSLYCYSHLSKTTSSCTVCLCLKEKAFLYYFFTLSAVWLLAMFSSCGSVLSSQNTFLWSTASLTLLSHLFFWLHCSRLNSCCLPATTDIVASLRQHLTTTTTMSTAGKKQENRMLDVKTTFREEEPIVTA